MAGRQSIVVGFIAVLALTGSAGAPSATKAGIPSAKVVGIQVTLPGRGGATAGAVTGPPDAVGVGGGFAYPADGSIAQAASVSSSVSGGAGATTSASGSTEISGLSLFGGEITASSITARASAKAGKIVTGEAKGSSVTGVAVMGQAVGPGASVAYGSWGTVSVLQQSGSQFVSDDARGFQARVTGLMVNLTAEHRGVPAGTTILVGYVDVSAQRGAAVSEQKPEKTAPRERPKPKAKLQRAPKKSLLPPIREIPFNVFPKLTAGGYVFPVYGTASYSETFGAPRAHTGWHHGADIFAPLGAPILAVANGIVYSVGWNDVGGLRLWLQDEAGNEFYYAHLSAYSPLAMNGAQVRAGDVLGFVGNTGDADGTAYHLHFEIHPTALLYMGYDGAVAPTPYLNAWRRLQDVPLTGVSGWAPPISDSSRAPKPGAFLLQSRDISSATGLEPASLRRAMRPGGQAEGDPFSDVAAEGRKRLRALALTIGGP